MDNKEFYEKLNKALNKIRPYLQADGGDIELVEVTDDMVVKVRLTGACDACPFNISTLKAGVEQAVQKELPQVKQVVAVNTL